MSSGRVLKPIGRHDLDAVLEIERSAYPLPWSYGIFYDCLLAKYECQGLWENKQLLGYFVAQQVVDEMHLLNICIDPSQQRRGLGEHLLQTLLQLSGLRDLRRLLLEVRISNTPAQALYRKLGFSEIGRRKNYYPTLGGREDAIVMALDLALHMQRLDTRKAV